MEARRLLFLDLANSSVRSLISCRQIAASSKMEPAYRDNYMSWWLIKLSLPYYCPVRPATILQFLHQVPIVSFWGYTVISGGSEEQWDDSSTLLIKCWRWAISAGVSFWKGLIIAIANKYNCYFLNVYHFSNLVLHIFSNREGMIKSNYISLFLHIFGPRFSLICCLCRSYLLYGKDGLTLELYWVWNFSCRIALRYCGRHSRLRWVFLQEWWLSGTC